MKLIKLKKKTMKMKNLMIIQILIKYSEEQKEVIIMEHFKMNQKKKVQ